MRRLLFAASTLPVLATIASCLGPTEIMVDITTNACGTLARADIYVGGATVPVTSAQQCATAGSTDVGTIAVLPSGALDGHIDVTVVGALGASKCITRNASEAGCIVANRSLTFSPHVRLDLPIFLDAGCAGHTCPAGQTCVVQSGGPTCVGDACNQSGGISCGTDAGSDDGSFIIDASPPVEDASACALIASQGTPTFIWSFESNGPQIREDHDATPAQTLVGATFATAPPTFCGQYLSPTSAQAIAGSDAKLGTRSFTVAFAYRATTDGTLLQLFTTSQAGGGFVVDIQKSTLDVTFTNLAPTNVFVDDAKTADGVFHTFVMDVETMVDDAGAGITSLAITRDGTTMTKTTPVAYHAANSSLVVGPIDAIDQVAFYAR